MDKLSNYDKFHGIDASNEISLFEYGLLVCHYEDTDYSVVCKYGEQFYTSFSDENDINGLVLGTDWMSTDGIIDFLSFVGQNRDTWIDNEFVTKLYDLIQYFGPDSVIGSPDHLFDIENI